MTTCPKIADQDTHPEIVSRDDFTRLYLDTYSRTVGTKVTFSCYNSFRVVGVTSATCKSNGRWDYPIKPYCEEGGTDTGTGAGTGSTDGDLDGQTQVLIGVLCGVAALILVILLIIILCVYCRRARRRDGLGRKREVYRRYSRDSRSDVSSVSSVSKPEYVNHVHDHHHHPTEDRHRHVAYDPPLLIDNLNHTPNPVATVVYVPPPYEPNLIQDLYTGTSHHRSNDGASYSGARTGQTVHSPDMYGHLRHPYHNPKTGFTDPAAERRGIYTGEWIDRGTIKALSTFNRRALVHGRDPFLWKNVDTNWGVNTRKPDW